MKKVTSVFLSLVISLTMITNIYALDDEKFVETSREKLVDNILLIGKDGGQSKGASRSDTMVILTIDNLNKSLKLTSLARDTLVNIPGKGYEKLNHAYAYGKENLLLQTINNNFNLNIKDYAVVDFNSFIDVIDILGGVEVDVKDKELESLNKTIKCCYGLKGENKGKIEYIDTEGIQKLNGYQALAYARIRKLDTIYKRDERQRKILISLARELSNTSITNYPKIMKNVLRHVQVNISLDKLMNLAFSAHELASYDIKQMQFPLEQYREEGQINGDGMYVVKWKEEENLKVLHQFIYEK